MLLCIFLSKIYLSYFEGEVAERKEEIEIFHHPRVHSLNSQAAKSEPGRLWEPEISSASSVAFQGLVWVEQEWLDQRVYRLLAMQAAIELNCTTQPNYTTEPRPLVLCFALLFITFFFYFPLSSTP